MDHMSLKFLHDQEASVTYFAYSCTKSLATTVTFSIIQKYVAEDVATEYSVHTATPLT